ncbi:MAG: cupin domain-containing protein [Dehalococcoidia bacterium]
MTNVQRPSAAPRQQGAADAGRRSRSRAIVRGPGDGHVIPGPEGITLKATGDETGGSIGFFEGTTPAGFGPPRHIHHTCDELFYVLSGEFEFLLGDQVVHAGPGTFVFIPRGTVHAPKVAGTEPGRVIAAFVPGGQEQAFEEFAKLVPAREGEEPDAEELQAIAKKYDSELVGPPL